MEAGALVGETRPENSERDGVGASDAWGAPDDVGAGSVSPEEAKWAPQARLFGVIRGSMADKLRFTSVVVDLSGSSLPLRFSRLN